MQIKCKYANYDEMTGYVCVNGNSEHCTEHLTDNCIECKHFETDYSVMSKEDINRVKDDAYMALREFKTPKTKS